jgi:hypothetical protein
MAVGKHDVTVTPIGSSPVVDISVVAAVPRTAQDLTNALGRIVVNTLGGQQDARKRQLMRQTRAQQQRIYAERKDLVTRLSTTTSPDSVARLSAQITSYDQQLGDIASMLRDLAIPSEFDGSAMFISPAPQALPVHRNLLIDALLALLAGLVAGLLASSVIEVFRPKVADPRTLCRDLAVPFLGHVAMSKDLDRVLGVTPETLVALDGAAAQTSTTTVVMVGCGQRAKRDGTLEAVGAGLRHALALPAAHNGHIGPSARGDGARATVQPPVRTPTDGDGSGVRSTPVLEAQGRDLRAHEVLDVQLLSDVLAREDHRLSEHAVLMVATLPAPQADVDRVTDLSAATGWPVLGVLEVQPRAKNDG